MKKMNISNLIIVLITLFTAIVISMIIYTTNNKPPAISSDTRFVSSMVSFVCVSVGVITLFLIYFISISIYKNVISFQSINKEILYSKASRFELTPNHSVLCILKLTEKDCFVLACFQKTNEIEPAVYTRHGKRITLINLRIRTTYYKKIHLDEEGCDNNTSVRIRRLKNKSTKTQMIFFASTYDNLEIYIKNKKIPAIDSKGRTKNYTVYGIIETPETMSCNTVKINGTYYDLIDNINNNSFINKNELIVAKTDK